MTVDAIVRAIGLPDSALVNQRVPKKMLVENGAPTAADKRRINDGIEEIYWLAALKPNTIGVPEYSDDVREYLEIALLAVTLRSEAKSGRLAELIHRAIPYPLLLILAQGDKIILSLTHKRRAQNEADKFVLDGDSIEVTAFGDASLSAEVSRQFLDALALSKQPRASLLQLYQGWIDTVVALQASQISGTFSQAITKDAVIARREAVQKCGELEVMITSLRNAAANEKQMGRRVELNLEIKGLEAELAKSKGKL